MSTLEVALGARVGYIKMTKTVIFETLSMYGCKRAFWTLIVVVIASRYVPCPRAFGHPGIFVESD